MSNLKKIFTSLLIITFLLVPQGADLQSEQQGRMSNVESRMSSLKENFDEDSEEMKRIQEVLSLIANLMRILERIDKEIEIEIEDEIKVTSPIRGEDLVGGEKQAIEWKAKGEVREVAISLCGESSCCGEACAVIRSGVSASRGKYSWWIDPDHSYVPSDALRIKIEDAKDEGVYDYSGEFSIIHPDGSEISVTSPKRGEEWVRSPEITDTISGYEDYTKSIKWEGAPSDFHDIFREEIVKVFLDERDRISYREVGRIAPFAEGSIRWVVGVVSDSDCSMPSQVRDLRKSCFHDENMKLVPEGEYYVRVVNEETGEEKRSEAFRIIE